MRKHIAEEAIPFKCKLWGSCACVGISSVTILLATLVT